MSSLIRQYAGDDFGEFYEETRDAWEQSLSLVFNCALSKQFAKKMAECSIDELIEFGKSFEFKNCIIHKDWAKEIQKGCAFNT